MYLALAQRLALRMVTADRRFVNALLQTEHADVTATLAEWLTAE